MMKQHRLLPWLLGLLSLIVIARWMGFGAAPETADVVEPVQRPRPTTAAPDASASLSTAPRVNDEVPAVERFDSRVGVALFGLPPAPVKVVSAPPAPAPPPPPPAPVLEAPPPPRPGFSVMGVYRARGEAPSLWITLAGQLILAQVGDVIDSQWRIESIDRQRVRLLHASQGLSAELPIPAEVAR